MPRQRARRGACGDRDRTPTPPLELGDAFHRVMELVDLPEAETLEPLAEAICEEHGIPESAEAVVAMARLTLEALQREGIASNKRRGRCHSLHPIAERYSWAVSISSLGGQTTSSRSSTSRPTHGAPSHSALRCFGMSGSFEPTSTPSNKRPIKRR